MIFGQSLVNFPVQNKFTQNGAGMYPGSLTPRQMKFLTALREKGHCQLVMTQ